MKRKLMGSAYEGCKVLSVRQPWADAIIFAGKDVENRTWRTSYRGPLLIHASKRWGPAERETLADLLAEGVPIPPGIAERLGGIIGRVELVGCVTSSASPWFAGPVGLVLARPEPLPFDECRGMLGIFDPRDVIARDGAVSAAMRAARP